MCCLPLGTLKQIKPLRVLLYYDFCYFFLFAYMNLKMEQDLIVLITNTNNEVCITKTLN